MIKVFICGSNGVFTLAYSGTGTRTGKTSCMRLYRMFHITQEPGPESGPQISRMGLKPILQDLKVIPDLSCNGFLYKKAMYFFTLLTPVHKCIEETEIILTV